jgi:Fe-S-cluster containining protein
MTNKKNKKTNKRKNLSPEELVLKNQRRTLGDKLNGIYTEDVNLETTMTCVCTCCKVAMPQIHYSEFLNIVDTIWNAYKKEELMDLIGTSIEYYFYHDYAKFGMKHLIKPCMFLNKETNLCKIYEKRPLSCRIYGLWPKEEYEKRVDSFVSYYSQYGLTRDDIPLAKQCDKVKRVDESKELSMDVINSLYAKLDSVDVSVGKFSKVDIEAKVNVRTFHDWLMWHIYGEQMLCEISSIVQAGTKEHLEELIVIIKDNIHQQYKNKAIPKPV